jgi:hypothetical protein
VTFAKTLILILLPGLLAAQLPLPKLSLVGGVSHYDFGGAESEGSAPIGAIRVEVPVVLFVAEGSLGLFRPRLGGTARTEVIPEVQAQWQLIPIAIRPYVGVGVGWLKPLSGPSVSEVTYSGSVGVRGNVPLFPLGVRAEVRYRILGSTFNRHATEITLGVIW